MVGLRYLSWHAAECISEPEYETFAKRMANAYWSKTNR